MTIDPPWSSEDISTIVANIIPSIKLIPNRVTKIAPFESHYGSKPNTALSNIVTKPNKHNLSYNHIKNFASDRRLLKQPVLSPAAMWDMEQEQNIQYKEGPKKIPNRINNSSNESDDSENAPLLSPTRTPVKIIPSKLAITFGDKTSTIVYNKKQVARKTIARKAPKPRGILKPQWNIIENGTITNYSPHTKTLDINNQKNTVIRKNNLAFVTKPMIQQQEPAPPAKRLIYMVACKSLREYNNNQEKINKFCLEEKRQAKLRQQALIPGPSSIPASTPTENRIYTAMRKLSNWQRTINRNNRKDVSNKSGKSTPRNNNQNNNSILKDGKSIQCHTKNRNKKTKESTNNKQNQTNPSSPNQGPPHFNKQRSIWRRNKIDLLLKSTRTN